MIRIVLTILITLTLSCYSHAQPKTSDFLNGIETFDYSPVLLGDTVIIEDAHISTNRTEPIGFFGDNYQRFYIHLISVIQNPNNRLLYHIYGKTKLKGNISQFQGTVTIKECKTYDEGDIPKYKQGFIAANYEFYEDAKYPGTGKFSGTLTSSFYIDDNNRLRYDALFFGADGFENNQYEGTWTSYKSGKDYICNWGDYRIPNSGDLDLGAGEFGVNDKYYERGWKSYEVPKGYGTNATKEEIEEAKKAENKNWWK